MAGQVDFLIKLRDGLALILDATTEYLETLAPLGASPTGPSYDVAKIAGVRTEGPRGIYEKITDNGPDAEALRKDLVAHKGKLTIDGAFYWLFEDQRTIGRKPRGSK